MLERTVSYLLATLRPALAAAVLSAPAADATAAGYQLRQQNAAALGTALAGSSAGAHGLADAFWNPAVSGRVERPTLSLSATYLGPRTEIEDAGASTVLGTAIAGSSRDDDVTPDTPVPALYAAVPAGERLRFALAVNAPFGLATDYPDNWVGRYHARETEVATINVNPMAAMRVHDDLTVAAGVFAQYFDARLTNAVDFGTLGQVRGVAGAAPGANDGRSELTADDWGVGFNLGLTATPLAGTRIGLAYRSRVDHGLRGDGDFTLDGAGVGAALQAATGAFSDTGIRADVTTPQIVSLGLSHDLTPELTALAELQWTGWSSFESLVIRFDNPAQANDVTEERWQDSWFAALGLSYRPTTDWTLRAGVAYDESPVPDDTRTPRIPDADRTWLSLGAGFDPASWLHLDASYAHLFMPAERIRLSANDRGSTFRGNLNARTDTSVHVFALGGTVRF